MGRLMTHNVPSQPMIVSTVPQLLQDDLIGARFPPGRQKEIPVFVRLMLCVTCLVSLSFPVSAQDLLSYVSIGTPPSWVTVAPAEKPQATKGYADPLEYLIADQQIRTDAQSRHSYGRYAFRLNTTVAVEGNSTVTVDFDPEFQTVIFHTLEVTRHGQTRALLDLSEFSLYRAETDRDNLIYNGTLQLSYIVPDLRVGDVLDYSFSVVGKNPAIGPHASESVQLEYGIPVGFLRTRLLFPEDYSISLTPMAGAGAPVEEVIGGDKVYAWAARDVPARRVEDNQPRDTISYPGTLASSFESWQDVGRYFAPFYDVTGPKAGPIAEVAARIRAEHASDAERLRAALGFVQREVRYLGIELGAGGYIPRPATQVLDRRFGDCKDMVVLLTTLLDALDIKAAPLLVNSATLGGVAQIGPTYAAFDHVIAVAWLDDKTYFLDPTRGEQLGDLDRLQQGNFGKGVVIAADSPGLIDVAAPLPPFFKVFKDRFVTTAYDDAIRLISVSEYYMREADSIMSWVKSDGKKEVERQFLEYYQGVFDGLEATGPLELEVFEAEGMVRLTADYRIPEGWEYRQEEGETHRYLAVEPNGFFDHLPELDTVPRRTARAIAHPVRTRVDVEVVLDDTWELEAEDDQFEHPAFDLGLRTEFRNGTLNRRFTYVTKAGRIEPKDIKSGRIAIRDVQRISSYTLRSGPLEPGNVMQDLRRLILGE